MDRLNFAESTVIDRPAADVFDYSQDYEHRLEWDTFLQRADVVNGAAAAGPGVRTYCVAKNGIGMETEYVSFRRPKVRAVRMTDGPYLFSTFLGSWQFKALTPERTEVVFTYAFSLRFPFNLVGGFVRRRLRANVRQRLRDLRGNLERQTA